MEQGQALAVCWPYVTPGARFRPQSSSEKDTTQRRKLGSHRGAMRPPLTVLRDQLPSPSLSSRPDGGPPSA